MSNATFRKVTLTWKELSEVLSKAGILIGDEDVSSLTLTKPRRLLIHTNRVAKVREVKPTDKEQ